MNKKIFLFSLLTSIIGIVNTFLFFIITSTYGHEDQQFDSIYHIFNTLKPYSFISPDFFINLNITPERTLGYSLNLVELFLGITFLVGAILFFTSNGKETKLIRFNLSLVILSKVFSIPYIIMNATQFDISFFLLFHWIFWGVYTYIAYKMLTYLNQQKELKIVENQITVSSKIKRFFHLIFDLTLTYILVYEIIYDARHNETIAHFLNRIEEVFGESIGLCVLLATIRIIYYLAFEHFFQSTPAKFLTGTRIYNEEDQIPSFKSTFTRTLSRLIPFDSFSFLFGNNWHDSLSDTYVVDEQKNGISQKFYFLFLGILMIIFTTLYFLQ